MSYRVGRKLGKTLYRGNVCIGYFDRVEDAKLARDALNAPDEVRFLLARPPDGGPKLRPHGTTGMWQVWTGGIWVAILNASDLEPVRGAR